MIDPYRSFRLRWVDECQLLTVRLPRRLVETAMAERVGGERPCPARFALRGPRTLDAGRGWKTVRDLVVSEAVSGGITTSHALVRGHLSRLLASTLVAAFESSDTAGTARVAGGGRILPRGIRRAVELIDGEPERDVSPLELAAAAGVGVRTLYEGFRRHLGRSPMEYVREVRLDRARADLVAGEPGRTTVAAVASSWGFGNLGRFARDYASRHGEPPSETLRR